jgi:hypothetical protein
MAACWLAAGYRGAVLGLPVFARVAVDGTHLHGRYFYESKGLDIPVEGTLSADGVMHLTEGDPAAPSGRFEGACEPSTGAFAGTWTGDRNRGAFRWVPVPPDEHAIGAVKRFKMSRPARKPEPDAHIRACSYAESRVELFGLRDAAVERAVNRQGVELLPGPVIDRAIAKSIDGCSGFGFDEEESRTLVSSFRELATIETQGWIDGGGMHPTELGSDLVTFDLRTGLRVTERDVLARDPIERVAICAAKGAPDDGMDESQWRDHLSASQLDLEPDGVHFFAADFPHAMAALSDTGPVIGYDVLLRDGYLRQDSPVKRAWRGVEPAAKGKDWCAADKTDAGRR